MATKDPFFGKELMIKRLCRDDAGFAAVWSDFKEATHALAHWQREAAACEAKMADYENLVSDLLAEVQDLIHRQEQAGSEEPHSRV